MQHLLALTVPGYPKVSITPLLQSGAQNPIFPNDPGCNCLRLNGVISGFLSIALYIAGALMIFWIFWGIFQYIFAGGSKEKLAQARKRIIFAFVGFAIVLLAYNVNVYVSTIYVNKLDNGVTPVSTPTPITP